MFLLCRRLVWLIWSSFQQKVTSTMRRYQARSLHLSSYIPGQEHVSHASVTQKMLNPSTHVATGCRTRRVHLHVDCLKWTLAPPLGFIDKFVSWFTESSPTSVQPQTSNQSDTWTFSMLRLGLSQCVCACVCIMDGKHSSETTSRP